ncbi:MAG: DMT family transporter [Alphaproteobacteria bacterium]|mgnify:CR=1 FL=1
MPQSPKLLGFFFVCLATLCWSVANILIKFVMNAGVPPDEYVGFRTVIAFAFALTVVSIAAPAQLRITRRDVFYLAGYGVVVWALSPIIGTWSIKLNPVAIAVVLLYTSPLFTLAWSIAIGGERVEMYEIVAALMAIAGVVLISGAYDSADFALSWPGLVVGLLAGLGLSFVTVFGKRGIARLGPWTILCYGLGSASIVWIASGTPFDFIRAPHAPDVWAAVVGAAFLTAILPVWFYLLGLRRISATEANITAILEPLLTTGLAFALLAERLDAPQLAGAAILLSGIAYLQIRAGVSRAAAGGR